MSADAARSTQLLRELQPNLWQRAANPAIERLRRGERGSVGETDFQRAMPRRVHGNRAFPANPDERGRTGRLSSPGAPD